MNLCMACAGKCGEAEGVVFVVEHFLAVARKGLQRSDLREGLTFV
jgi:hypothetical protein